MADVDLDGKDEVLHMDYAINGDGSLRYHIDEVVHGDAGTWVPSTRATR